MCNTTSKYFAEFIGTLILVLLACGTAVIAGDQVGYLGISLAFGLTLTFLIYAIGPISGCHVNPAVTIALLINGKICVRNSIGYIISQCLGALVGAFLIKVIVDGVAGTYTGGFGQNGFLNGSPGGYDLNSAIAAEVILTFIFVYVILKATSAKGNPALAGLAIGSALTVIHLIGIPVTGTSVNPARSFGPAIMAGGEALSQLWVFIVAPLGGAILAGLAHKLCCGKCYESCDAK